MAKPNEGRSRVVIETVEPQINCGLFAIKRIIGDLVTVEADVFGDGHDHVRARLLWKEEGASGWESVDMRPLGNDRWRGEFTVDKIGRYRYTLVHGRHSTPVEVLLRMLICKHLFQWSYQETVKQVYDNVLLRWFCRVYWTRPPSASTTSPLADSG